MPIVDLERMPPNDQKALRAMVDAAYVRAAKIRQSRLVTLQERIDELVQQHGSLRAVARVTEIDAGYLSRLRAGEKVRPSGDKLRRLGLRSVVSYERLKTPNVGGNRLAPEQEQR